LGAAGRDFHDFIVRYRDDLDATVVAFRLQGDPACGRATPGRTGRRALSGRHPDRGRVDGAPLPIILQQFLAEAVILCMFGTVGE
jgi:hypothetical protein